MAQDDPFTLDLFGSSAISSGLGPGVTAFAGVTCNPDDDDDPDPSPGAPALPLAAVGRSTFTAHRAKGANFRLCSDRALAKGWKDRARDNIAAIRLATAIEADERAANAEEQAQLIRFTGFGASELANSVFRQPGEADFRKGWEAIGEELEDVADDLERASLARCTQYAHFTPEFIIRAIWAGLQRLGWRGGRVLESGIGTGLFPALMPDGLRDVSHVTGIELDPVTARIARLTTFLRPSRASPSPMTTRRTNPLFHCGRWGPCDDWATGPPSRTCAHGSRAGRDAAASPRRRAPDRGTRRADDDHRTGEAPAARPERIELDER